MCKIVDGIIEEVKHVIDVTGHIPSSVALGKTEWRAYVKERREQGNIHFTYHGTEYTLPKCRRAYG